MRPARWVLACAGLAIVSSVSAKVMVDHDRTADFSARRTYAWMKGTEAPNALVEKRIHEAVDCFDAWTPGTGVAVRDSTTGTLMVDLVDPVVNKLIWRGVATEAGSIRTPRKSPGRS